MKRLLLLLLVTFAAPFFVGLAAAADSVKTAPNPQTAAQLWLKLLDDGKDTQAWENAASQFKKAVTQKDWQSAVRELRGSKGKLISRKIQGSEQTKNLVGAPKGNYMTVRFESSFEEKSAITETVTLFEEKDQLWKVAAYTIK